MTGRILALDIETRPAEAYVWGMHKVNISVDQLINPGGIICVGAHWLDTKESFFFAEWQEGGHEGMLRGIYDLMSESEAVLTFNGDAFDLPRLDGAFLLHKFKPLPPLTSIDVYKTTKKMRYISGKLAFVGPLLGVGGKVKHQGFSLWRDVIAGDEKARKKMEKYCVQDVRLLAKLYHRIKPFIRSHPFFGTEKQDCGTCGKGPLQKRGYRRTKSFIIQRLQCQSCGAWQEGTRKKV